MCKRDMENHSNKSIVALPIGIDVHVSNVCVNGSCNAHPVNWGCQIGPRISVSLHQSALHVSPQLQASAWSPRHPMKGFRAYDKHWPVTYAFPSEP